MHRHHAGLQAVRRDEIEMSRALQALKQGRSMAGEDRVDVIAFHATLEQHWSGAPLTETCLVLRRARLGPA